METLNYYDRPGFDRAGHLRRDQEWLLARLADEKSQIVPIWRSRNLVADIENPALTTIPMNPDILEESPFLVFLGLVDTVAHFAVDLTHHKEPPLTEYGSFEDLRRIGPLLPRDQGSLLAFARAHMTWHKRHLFCGLCGSETESREGGHVRVCKTEGCGAHCFPRIDPAVIMLIHDGNDRVVLGRKKTMQPGQHSILAGFVEPGESLENAVAREVFEEVGLEITDITYHSSQPWPFPANIMLGFTARATTFDLTVDYNELEGGAVWFTKDYLRNSPENDIFRMPRKDSISRRLLNEWLES
jgi:NAD+ diphosphatase